MFNFNKMKKMSLKDLPNPNVATLSALKKAVSKNSRGFRMRVKKGLPNSRKMKEGQLKLCIIKNDLYLIVKHKKKLFKTKFTDEKL